MFRNVGVLIGGEFGSCTFWVRYAMLIKESKPERLRSRSSLCVDLREFQFSLLLWFMSGKSE